MKYKKRKLIVIAIVLLISLAGLTAYSLSQTSKQSDPKGSATDSDINYAPPTKEEREAGDKAKENITDNEQLQQKNKSQDSQSATVVITDAGQYGETVEVRAFIPDHYEDGTCTIHFSQASHVIKKTVSSYRDASTTICTNPMINVNEFPNNGTWELYVTYSSPGATGQSEKQQITLRK